MVAYDLRPCSIEVVRALCEEHHGYASAGRVAVYAFAVYEDGRPVAAYAWQPPPPGAARSVCPEQPAGVLALSRMVAVPRADRRLNHVSRPLRRQMRRLIDRGRWPVLVTYHDEGQGHTGHVYMCSGWTKTTRRTAAVYVDGTGARVSRYANGREDKAGKTRQGSTVIQRWEHWACDVGSVCDHMRRSGWHRAPVIGKVWRSGAQAYSWRRAPAQLPLWVAQ